MRMFLKVYGLALGTFLAIDAVWLTLIARGLYADQLGYLMADQPNLVAALGFYLVFIVGLVYFVILPALKTRDQRRLLASAALFGLVTYATYDLTNLATIRDWPLMITVIDLAWGTTISVLVSVLSVRLATRLRLK